MPISGHGWELHVVRQSEQRRSSDGRRRTVGRYQVYHDGNPVAGADFKGMTAEAKGPGANTPADNGKRIEPGSYPLWTQVPGRYATLNYSSSTDVNAEPKPGIELRSTGARYAILVHPGHDFLASVGCINLCKSLPNAQEQIDYVPSRKRVISVINDMMSYVGSSFPTSNGRKIPNAWVVVDGEP